MASYCGTPARLLAHAIGPPLTADAIMPLIKKGFCIFDFLRVRSLASRKLHERKIVG